MELDQSILEVKPDMNVISSDGRQIGRVRSIKHCNKEAYVEVPFHWTLWRPMKPKVGFLPHSTVGQVEDTVVNLNIDAWTANRYTSIPGPCIAEGLWNTLDGYGSNGKYCEHVLEQYKLYVDSANKISDRRNLANSFFLTLHTLLVGIAGFAFKEGTTVVSTLFIIPPLLAVLTLCYAWWRLIKSYRQLNTGKFSVIAEYEKRLPSRPHNAEWNALGDGKDSSLYKPLTEVENLVPLIFGLIYIMIAGAILLAVQ